jgi:hypothetical protein
MSTEAKIAMMLSIDKDYRDRLRILAAEQNLKDPTQVVTASGIARDIVCDYLDRIHDGSD